MLDVIVYGYGERLFVGGEAAEAVDEYHLLAWLILYGVVIFLHVK